MKTLYESILTDIDDTLTNGDIAVERMGTFSERFKFIGVYFPKGTAEAASKGLNITVLRQLVKNIKHLNPDIAKATFDKHEKIKMFAQWLDKFKFKDLENLGVNTSTTNNIFRDTLANNLSYYCFANNIFTNNNMCLTVRPIHETGKDNLTITCGILDKYGTYYQNCFIFKYKII